MATRAAQTITIFLVSVIVTALPATPSAAMFHSVQVARHERTFVKAWQTLKDNYYDRQKISNWDRWKQKFHGKISTRADLERALNTMVDSLNDDYTFVLSEADLDKRAQNQKQKSISATRMLPNQIGYIKLDSFVGDSISAEMKIALRRLNSAQGLILDLRGNHGGFIDAAHDVFSMLCDEGTFMSYDGFMNGAKDDESFVLRRNSWHVMKNGKLSTERRNPNISNNKPLLVLVNDDTRSAAEMLAGALRDNGRAVVVGEKTYGKGVLQDTFEVGEHLAVKVVTAKYYLPDGSNIHEKGISPDIELGGTPDAQLNRAAQMLASAVAQARSSGRRFLAVIEQNAANL